MLFLRRIQMCVYPSSVQNKLPTTSIRGTTSGVFIAPPFRSMQNFPSQSGMAKSSFTVLQPYPPGFYSLIFFLRSSITRPASLEQTAPRWDSLSFIKSLSIILSNIFLEIGPRSGTTKPTKTDSLVGKLIQIACVFTEIYKSWMDRTKSREWNNRKGWSCILYDRLFSWINSFFFRN